MAPAARLIDANPLDELLPTWHWRNRHTTVLATAPLAAFAAAREVTLSELPTAAAKRRVDPGVTVIDDLVAQGFVPLAEPDDASLVLGRIGHFWQYGGRSTDARHFVTFAEPGFAKAALLFSAMPLDERECLLVVETRITATDPRTYQEFSRYWLVSAWGHPNAQPELLSAVRDRLGLRRFSASGHRRDSQRRPSEPG